MNAPLLQLREAQYAYDQGDFKLSCPNLCVTEGGCLLIRGATGSGKSTLGKLMAGILKPRQGELLLNGNVANDYPLGRIGQTVGYLFQEPGRQLFCATVGEELLFKACFLGEDLLGAQEKAAALLQSFGLSHLHGRSIYRLSRGEKQRLALAAVMMQGARLLLLDEPTSGLDQRTRGALCELLQELLANGTAIAIISHDSLLVQHFATAEVMLENGVVLC